MREWSVIGVMGEAGEAGAAPAQSRKANAGVVLLPADECAWRVVAVPAMLAESRTKLRQFVQLEVERLLPEGFHTPVVAFVPLWSQVTGGGGANTGGQALAVAMPTERLSRRFQQLKQIGLEPFGFLPVYLALAAAPRQATNARHLRLWVTPERVELVAFVGDQFRLAHAAPLSAPAGSEPWIHAVRDVVRLVCSGLTDPPSDFEALPDDLTMEVWGEDALAEAVRMAFPSASIRGPLAPLATDVLRSLRDQVLLVSAEVRNRVAKRARNVRLGMAAASLVVLVLAGATWGIRSATVHRQAVVAFATERQHMAADLARAKQLETGERLLRAATTTWNQRLQQQLRWDTTLSALSAGLADDGWLGDLTLESAKPFSMRGFAKDDAALGRILQRLNGMDVFHDVRLIQARVETLEGRPVVAFTVTGTVAEGGKLGAAPQ